MYEQVKTPIGTAETKQPTLEQSVVLFWEETKILEETFEVLCFQLEKFKRPNNFVDCTSLKNGVEKIETRSSFHIEIDKMADFVRSFRYKVGEQTELIDA